MFSLSQSSAGTSSSSGGASDLQTVLSPSSSGSHSHDETDPEEMSDPPRKRLRRIAGLNNVKRIRGFLAGIVNVPMDIFAQIMSFLLPIDVHSIARTNKKFRKLLMSRSARNIWRMAERNVPNLPPCPSHMTEPQYAALLFGKWCSTCGGTANVSRRMDEILLVRLCSSCRERSIVGISSIPERVHSYVRLSHSIKSSMQNSHCYGLIDDVNSVVSTVFELAIEGDALKTDEWRGDRLEQIEKEKIFAFKLTGYLNRVEEEREERVEELKRRRFVAIKAHLMRDGWEEADCEVDFEGEEAYEMLQKDWDRLVNQPKPLTIRSWESIKLKVTRIAEIYREFRLEAERTYRGMERRLKLGELVTAIDTEEPQIIELAPEHDHSSDQSESLTIPFPNWTRALNLWTLRQIAEEDISGLVAEQRFMSRRGMIVQELRNWQRSLAACLVRKLETRDHFGLGDLLVCRMPFMPGLRRTHPPEPVELSTAFTADSSQYILDNDIRTLLRADSVFEFYDYPTCYYFPEIVAIVRDKLLPPPSYIPARYSEDDRDDIYSTNPMGLHGVGAHRLGRRAARGLLASLGKQNAAYLEMSGYGRRFVCGRCWVKTPMTWIEMVTHYARNVTYNWNFPITCSLRAEGIECKEEHGGFKSNVIGTRNKTRADEQSEFQVTTRPLVRLLSIDELNSLESEPLSTQFTCGVCDQVADLHNGQGLDGKPIPRPKGSREVMIEHLLDVHNVTQDMHQFKLNECT